MAERNGQERNAFGSFLLSLLIAFAGILLISFFSHWYEVVALKRGSGARQVTVNALTPVVFFLILVLVGIVNPLIGQASRSLALGARELFLVAALWLVTGAICHSNLTTWALAATGGMYSPVTEHPARVGIREYLRPELFLPERAAKEYNYGMSPDGVTRVRAVARSPLFHAEDFRDLGGLGLRLQDGKDPLSVYLRERLSADVIRKLTDLARSSETLLVQLTSEVNRLLEGPCLYDEGRFPAAAVTEAMKEQIEEEPQGKALVRLNRTLLEAVYRSEMPKAGDESALLSPEDAPALDRLAETLTKNEDPVSSLIRERLPQATVQAIDEHFRAHALAAQELAVELNKVLSESCLVTEDCLAGLTLSSSFRRLANRLLLETAYPLEIAASPVPVSWPFQQSDLAEPAALAKKLQGRGDALSAHLWENFQPETKQLIEQLNSAPPPEGAVEAIVNGLNTACDGPLLYEKERIAHVTIPDATRILLNRVLLEEAYSQEIARVPASVPWGLWWGPLKFWGPFVLVFIVFSASLVRTMHRQWSKHELLTYPLGAVADSLIDREHGRALPRIFYDRVFWIGFGVVAFVYIINGLHLYFPLMIQIPVSFRHTDVLQKFHFLSKYCGREAYALFRGMLYIFMVAIAVLLPTDLSLTCWLGWVLMVFGTGVYFLLTGEVITHTETNAIQYGMYVAMAAAIFVIGRREYANILRCALFLGKSKDEELRKSARACRMFLLSAVAFWWLGVNVGLDWFVSIVLVLSFGLVVLLIARVTAETGIPWLPNFAGMATMLPLKLLGAAALGPQSLAAIAAIGAAFDAPSSSAMNSVAAQETTYGKLRERHKGWWAGAGFNLIFAVGICVALCASIFFGLWDNCSFGWRAEGSSGAVAHYTRTASSEIDRLKVEGRLEEVAAAKGLGKLRHVKFDTKFLRFFALGAVAVALCAFMRLRFAWWPFHPLPLLFINTWTMSRMGFSILLGWAIKVAILRIWGGKTYARLKPFFIGAIAGVVAVYGSWLVVGSIYYLMTDTAPKMFRTVFY